MRGTYRAIAAILASDSIVKGGSLGRLFNRPNMRRTGFHPPDEERIRYRRNPNLPRIRSTKKQRSVRWLPVAKTIGLAFTGVGLLITYGTAQAFVLAFFFKNGGAAMLLPLIALYILGHRENEIGDSRAATCTVAFLIFIMANMRGFYWDIFENGKGFWTANRISAWCAFALVFFAPWRRWYK